MTAASRPGGATAAAPGRGVAGVGEWLRSPVAPYYLVLSSAGLLLGLGLVMVLSASSVGSFLESGNSYKVFIEQLTFAGAGLVLAAVGSRLPVVAWRRLAWVAILLALFLEALVFSPLGVNFQGNRNWISIAGRSLQPSELGKVALVVFGAAVLAVKRKLVHRPAHVIVPFVFPFALALVALVLIGNDLGTAMVMLAIVVGMLWAAGVPGKWFAFLGAGAAAAVIFLASGNANRMARINTWIGGICKDPHVEGCFQKVHAQYAFADGGWWGVGLGESAEKWGLLPEPHNDFILAIIGEELGLWGTCFVLALFAVLAYACYRIVAQSEDSFVRLAASGVMVWFLSQAVINIGSVTGMLPIIGVPLPLVSSGGSALIAALIGVGLLLALARSLPGAAERLRGRPAALRQNLAVLPRRGAEVARPRALPRSRRPRGGAR